MIDFENNKGFIITIIVLLVISLGLGGFIVYDKFLTREEVEEILLEILSLKSTFNYQQYEESLKMMSEPISPSQLPKVEIDLRGMIEYAKTQEKKVVQLTDVEKGRFVHTCQ